MSSVNPPMTCNTAIYRVDDESNDDEGVPLNPEACRMLADALRRFIAHHCPNETADSTSLVPLAETD
jgi:hypothetical protein